MGPLEGCIVGLYVAEVRPALGAASCSGAGSAMEQRWRGSTARQEQD